MKTLRNSLIFLALAGLAISALFVGGCSKRLEGDTYPNQKPTVEFINVPPEDSRSSVNPIVNWIGKDIDGQVDYYRYLVMTSKDIGDSLGKQVDWNPIQEPLTTGEVQSFLDGSWIDYKDAPEVTCLDVTYTNEEGELRDTTICETTRIWTYLLVRADSTDPHSSNIIPMSAKMSDPVRSFVPQYVFVQAFDEEGLGSDVVFRRFLRNDNPPSTRIVSFIEGVPFINSVFPSGPATGIRMRWQGGDVIDYPTDPPPFEFEWKLFGPYSDSIYQEIIEQFVVEVFVTNDARVMRFGEPADSVGVDTTWAVDTTVFPWDSTVESTSIIWLNTALIVCDSSYPNGVLVESCDTILIDTLESSNVYGVIDTLIRVWEDDFLSDTMLNVVADSSHDDFGNVWVTDTRDSIYNAYWNSIADTTQAGKFLFVIRSRDDAHVPDLTPAFRGFTVINPEHERDILIINWSAPAHENKAWEDSVITFWDNAIGRWSQETLGHSDIKWDTDLDIHAIGDLMVDNAVLKLILKYKVAIMLQDAEVSGTWATQGLPVRNVMVALQTGVNVWVAARVPLGSHFTGAGLSVDIANPDYQYFFGVLQTTFPGWSVGFTNPFDGYGWALPRTEHFIGALSLDNAKWPDLVVDTALLRTSYQWAGAIGIGMAGFPFQPYQSHPGALPQVGWCVRAFDTEAMYLFNSFYGAEHAKDIKLSFHGRPVGIRLNRGLFRTVHQLFTPLALERESGQVMVNGVLNWLYDGRIELSSGSRSTRTQAVSSELADRYWQAYWNAGGDRETFYELLKTAY